MGEGHGGFEAKSHQGVGRLFSLHFVKTGLFETQDSRILSRAQKYREEADYTSEFVFSPSDAQTCLQESKTLISKIETFLKKKGLL